MPPSTSFIDEQTAHPYRSLTIAIIAVILTIASLSSAILFSEKKNRTFESYVIPMNQLRFDLTYYDEVLTESAVMAAATESPRWYAHYHTGLLQMDQTLKALEELSRDSDQSIKKVLLGLRNANEGMYRIEKAALELARDQRKAEALDLLENLDYLIQKEMYQSFISDLREAINKNTQAIREQEKIVAVIALIIAGVTVFVILPVILVTRIRLLKRWRNTILHTSQLLEGSKQELVQMNEFLNRSLKTTQKREEEVRLLGQMASILHSCTTTGEVFEVLKSHCLKLFPCSHGALFRGQDSQEQLEELGTWGSSCLGKPVFQPQECWGVRRGRMHVGSLDESTACAHINTESDAGVYLCAPLIAQNETLGLLYIVMSNSIERSDIEPVEFLVAVIAENVAQALANIKLRNNLREQSLRDPLTGLYNRRYFMESINQEIIRATRNSANLAVVAMDIDHFKRCNDTYGHAAGDKVLQEVATVLAKVFRGSDVICRQGGEEFVILLPDAALSAAQDRAEEVRETIAALQLTYSGESIGEITISGGVASYPLHGNSAEDLLKSADLALYEAKKNGRNRIETAGNEAPASTQDLSSLASL